MKLGEVLNSKEITQHFLDWFQYTGLEQKVLYDRCDGRSAWLLRDKDMIKRGYNNGNNVNPSYPCRFYQEIEALYQYNGEITNYITVYWGIQDTLIEHFLNRDISIDNVRLWCRRFSARWNSLKWIYNSLFNVWYDYYEGKTINLDADTAIKNIWADYLHEHESNSNGITKSSGKNTSTNNTTNTLNTTVETTSNGTGTSTGDGTSTTTDSGENTRTDDTTTSNTGNTRTLNSDTPQSMVNADTTGNPETISWTYASNLQDNIQNTQSKNTGTVKNANSSSGKTTNTETGKTTTESTTNTTNSGDTTIASSGNGTNESTNERKDLTKDTTTDYNDIQKKVNAFIGSPFSTFFYKKLFDDFEDLFDSRYNLTEGDTYVWKEIAVQDKTYPAHVYLDMTVIKGGENNDSCGYC